MKRILGALSFVSVSVFMGPAALAQATSSSCSAHHAGVDTRGDHVMGFDHDKTTHHFRLTSNGGIIEVSANAESDTASRDAIREHLSHIAVMFSEGDFEAPMLIHDRVPPGVPVMKQKGKAIHWNYVESPGGGIVLIVTEDPEARAAIYEFLRFQIEDHQTGDSLEITGDTPSKPRT